MANWLKNGPCPKCGSRDNLAHYDDGSKWCWGCHYYESRKTLPTETHKKDTGHKCLPDDTSTWFGPDSISWFSLYGFNVEDLIRHSVKFSPSKNQTIFTWPETDLWQARNHWPNKVKYFTSGNHDDVLPIYDDGLGFSSSDLVVLTEDALSAIKIAMLRGPEGATMASMPLLGTHLPTQKLNRLKGLYSKMVVWLDHDKGKESQAIADRAKMIGMDAKVISTDLDPKEYTKEELNERLYT